jgi:hypothetical protein
MATKKQIQANRLNSRKSTGPRSAEGKATSSQNALKSGIDSQSQVIRGEDPAALDALAAQYLLDHQPQSAAERALVDILIDSEWLLRRLRKTESHLWEYHLVGLEKRPQDQILGIAFTCAQETLARLERRRESLQRVYHRTLHDLRQIQDSRPPTEAQPAYPPGPPQEAPAPGPSPTPPSGPQIGFDPEIHDVVPSAPHLLTLEMPKPAPNRQQSEGHPVRTSAGLPQDAA